MTLHTKGGKILTMGAGLAPRCDCCSPPPPGLGACCLDATCFQATERVCVDEFGGTWKGAGVSCFPSPCGGAGACAANCEKFPTHIEATVDYSGFAPIPRAQLNLYEYARNGSAPASGRAAAAIGFDPAAGWFDMGSDWQGDALLGAGAVLRLAIGCRANIASAGIGYLRINLGPVRPGDGSTGNRWIPSLNPQEFLGAAWVAWQNEYTAAGKFPSDLCRNVCGTFVHKFTELVPLEGEDFSTAVPAGTWTLTMTLSGCGGNPLP